MKVKYLITFLLFILAAFSSCEEAAEYRDVLYMSGTEELPSRIIAVDGPSKIGVSVRASNLVTEDIKIKLTLSPELVDGYNLKYGKSYKALPMDLCKLLDADVLIEQGDNVSSSAGFELLSTDAFEPGVSYCMPVSISSNSGAIEVLESSRTVFIIFNKTIVTQAMMLGSNSYNVPSFLTDTSLEACPNVTMEARVYVKSFKNSKPFITTVMGLEGEFLMRFGDVKIDPNQLQVIHGAYNPASAEGFATNKWYHVAMVYSGAKLAMYINGKFEASVDADGSPINLTASRQNGFNIGKSYGSRTLDGYISECRVWTKALTANEINNNMCIVDPTAEGLLAYWRFDAKSGTKVVDLTGHGHDAIGSSSVPSFLTDVRCPE